MRCIGLTWSAMRGVLSHSHYQPRYHRRRRGRLAWAATEGHGLHWTDMDCHGGDCLPVPVPIAITIPITIAVVAVDSHGLPRRGMDCHGEKTKHCLPTKRRVNQYQHPTTQIIT